MYHGGKKADDYIESGQVEIGIEEMYEHKLLFEVGYIYMFPPDDNIDVGYCNI